jgi:hypothetical protein
MRRHKALQAILAALAAVTFTTPGLAKAADANISGIADFKFNPNPQEIKPKLYNWEIRLSPADSRAGSYEIVQITIVHASGSAAAPTTSVLVDSSLLTPNMDGQIDFNLYVGDKKPTQDMGRQGDTGQPIIFSGIGTAKAQSGWIILPGAKAGRVSPSPKGTRLSKGALNLIEFTGDNARGDRYEAEVMLRKK